MNFIKAATNAIESTSKSGSVMSRQANEHLNTQLTSADNEFASRTQNINESFKNASTSVPNENVNDDNTNSTGLLSKIEDSLSSLNIGNKNRTHERNYSVDNTEHNNSNISNNNYNNNNNNNDSSLIGGSLQKLHSINETVDEKLSSFISKKPNSNINNTNNNNSVNNETTNNESNGFFNNSLNKVHGLNQNIESKVESAMGLIGIKPTSSTTHNTPVHQSSQYNDSSFVERSKDRLDTMTNNEEKGFMESAKEKLSGLQRDHSNRTNSNNYDDADVEDNTNSNRDNSFLQGTRNKLNNIEEEIENKFNTRNNNNSSRSSTNTTYSPDNNNLMGNIKNNIGRKVESAYENNENDYNSNNNNRNNNNYNN